MSDAPFKFFCCHLICFSCIICLDRSWISPLRSDVNIIYFIWLPQEQFFDSLLKLVILYRVDKRIDDGIHTNHVDREAVKMTWNGYVYKAQLESKKRNVILIIHSVFSRGLNCLYWPGFCSLCLMVGGEEMYKYLHKLCAIFSCKCFATRKCVRSVRFITFPFLQLYRVCDNQLLLKCT